MLRQSVLFLIDTQGANCVGCYAGNPELSTPNIDGLAAAGVRFQQAYTCSPVCGPARSAIMTGLYPHSNGVLGNDQAPHLDLPTIGQRLRKEGVATGYVGKWHLDGSDYFGDGRCPEGWDPAYWFDGRNYLDSLPDDHSRALSRKVLGPKEVADYGITEEFTHAHRIADRARAYIEAHKDQDFFLIVSIDEPHHPFICPEPYVSSFTDFEFKIGPSGDDDLADKPESQREWSRHFADKHATLKRTDDGLVFKDPHYFGCNSYSDYEVGRVIAAIDEHIPDALVVYTSDHGDMFHAHSLYGKGPVVYDEICRIPFIVRWPSGAPEGVVSESPVSHIDLVPTVLDFFEIERPPLLQGKSLMQQCKDPGHVTQTHVFIEFNRFEIDHDGFGSFTPIRAICDGRFKLAINLLDTDELYDLQEDPHELVNRINDEGLAARRDALHDAIIAWQGVTRDTLRCPAWGRRSWRDLGGSTWGGPTRPRPFDDKFYPRSLLYDTAQEVDRFVYAKG
ncbi:MAG: sulfatase-like hydrolase/transferase [Synoicihabitans sp.]